MTVKNNYHFVLVTLFLSVCIVLYSLKYHKTALRVFYTPMADTVFSFKEAANTPTYTTICLETSPTAFDTLPNDFYSYYYKGLVYHHLVTDFITNHNINSLYILIANFANLFLPLINTADIANCN